MTKSKTTVAEAAKPTIKERAISFADQVAYAFAGMFFVATSYGYVSNWLEAHQDQANFSVAGGILIVAVALFLFVRNKR